MKSGEQKQTHPQTHSKHTSCRRVSLLSQLLKPPFRRSFRFFICSLYQPAQLPMPMCEEPPTVIAALIGRHAQFFQARTRRHGVAPRAHRLLILPRSLRGVVGLHHGLLNASTGLLNVVTLPSFNGAMAQPVSNRQISSIFSWVQFFSRNRRSSCVHSCKAAVLRSMHTASLSAVSF